MSSVHTFSTRASSLERISDAEHRHDAAQARVLRMLAENAILPAAEVSAVKEGATSAPASPGAEETPRGLAAARVREWVPQSREAAGRGQRASQAR